MTEKTKQKAFSKTPADRRAESFSDWGTNSNEDGNRTDEQKKSSYYYDDAYGYEVYDPAAEDDENEEDAGER